MNNINDYQKDMNTAYYYGVPGIIASGSVWLLAGLVALLHSANVGIATLIVGGTLIFPLSVLLCKALGRSGKHQKGNPLAPLAIEGTLWMLFSIPIAIGAAFYRPEWFFPAMMFVIGGRYLTFNTLYGNRIFWLFGGVLFAAAWLLLALQVPVYAGGLTGGMIELVFAFIIFMQSKKSSAD
ncbi:DUF7010 family protein [Gilvimarinus xylanilyticus]|uniref:Uncharacterized protein n=1 Tax=Gilvimarinus xylanilyticus TaxID=2944139 RepID=A0A9X2HYL6_9GAMM|nr:hypothetical protein [Gilvimarinus xylanilyticus]MCP8899484.1 hypothetical protein [Gilvimarinus xylanilyticus]